MKQEIWPIPTGVIKFYNIEEVMKNVSIFKKMFNKILKAMKN